jgi:hypothetical protein
MPSKELLAERNRNKLLKKALKQIAAMICLRDGLNPTDNELLAVVNKAFKKIKTEQRKQ